MTDYELHKDFATEGLLFSVILYLCLTESNVLFPVAFELIDNHSALPTQFCFHLSLFYRNNLKVWNIDIILSRHEFELVYSTMLDKIFDY